MYNGDMNIAEYLRDNSIYVPLQCGGNGTCGKCKVYVEGLGEVLACKTEMPKDLGLEDIRVLWESEEDIAGITVGLDGMSEDDNSSEPELEAKKPGRMEIAVDIGTTTIAVALVGGDGDIVDTRTAINHGRSYGADVISRIEAACSGKLEEMRKLLVSDINALIDGIIFRNHVDVKNIDRIAIAGNTTMLHILRGYDCSGLGKYPFKTANLEKETVDGSTLLGKDEWLGVDVVILPGISTYVGADIVAGLLSIWDDIKEDEISLFLDLGTNGEMALGNRNRLLVASTAAGPAFEGGRISHGVASIPGAICDVEVVGLRRIKCRTIDDKTPIGICGSGLISAVRALKELGVIDETGAFIDGAHGVSDKGYELCAGICITQQDIREFQMAKSAVRAGIQVLVERLGIDVGDIKQAYIAGGFGYALNIQAALDVELLPADLACEVKAAGNTSLGGAIRALKAEEGLAKAIRQVAEEVVLADDVLFAEKYIEYMNI